MKEMRELVSRLRAAHCVRILSHEQILNLEDSGLLSASSRAGEKTAALKEQGSV